MRIDIEPVNGRDGLAVRRSVKYHDGSVCRVDYLSFITGEWMQKEATGKLPKECFRDDELIELLELGPRGKSQAHTGVSMRRVAESIKGADQVTVCVDEKKNTCLLLRGSWAASMSTNGGTWMPDGSLRLDLQPHDEITLGDV